FDSQYRPSSQQLQNGSPGNPQVMVIFDDEKLSHRHFSTRGYQAGLAGIFPATSCFRSTGKSCSTAA
ncbi:MAG: hypothetical protein E5X94_04665, partial [Mesorhizobium sp.]